MHILTNVPLFNSIVPKPKQSKKSSKSSEKNSDGSDYEEDESSVDLDSDLSDYEEDESSVDLDSDLSDDDATFSTAQEDEDCSDDRKPAANSKTGENDDPQEKPPAWTRHKRNGWSYNPFDSIVPEDGTVEIDAEVKDDGTAPEVAAEERTGAAGEDLDVKAPAAKDPEVASEAADPVDPPADGADDGSALSNFPACLPGNWNVGRTKRVSTFRRCSELSGWVEQLVPKKGGKKFNKVYLSPDGGRFRTMENARSHATGVAAGDKPPGQ